MTVVADEQSGAAVSEENGLSAEGAAYSKTQREMNSNKNVLKEPHKEPRKTGISDRNR